MQTRYEPKQMCKHCKRACARGLQNTTCLNSLPASFKVDRSTKLASHTIEMSPYVAHIQRACDAHIVPYFSLVVQCYYYSRKPVLTTIVPCRYTAQNVVTNHYVHCRLYLPNDHFTYGTILTMQHLVLQQPNDNAA